MGGGRAVPVRCAKYMWHRPRFTGALRACTSMRTGSCNPMHGGAIRRPALRVSSSASVVADGGLLPTHRFYDSDEELYRLFKSLNGLVFMVSGFGYQRPVAYAPYACRVDGDGSSCV